MDKIFIMNSNSLKSLIFRPEKSRGLLFSIIFLLLVIMLFIILIIVIPVLNFHAIFLLFIIFVIICIVFLINFYNLDKMRYIITSEKKLVIKWGFLVKEIDFNTIIEITYFPIKSFQTIHIAGLRLPGYSIGLFELNLSGVYEKINMYATNYKSLVLIKVQKRDKIKYYGITPKAPDIFVKELNNRTNNKNI